MAQISVWDLILNCIYQSYDCKEIFGAANTRHLEEETKVGILVCKAVLGSFLEQNRTGNTVEPCGEIKMSLQLLSLITTKSFSNTYMEYDFTHFSLFLEIKS